MQILLEIRSGSQAGAPLRPVLGRFLRIGSNPQADHAFPGDPQMAAFHFAIQVSEKGCRLLDLNSKDGTFLNGARVKQAVLSNGDEIRAGGTVFVVRMLRDDVLPATEPVGAAKSSQGGIKAPKPAPVQQIVPPAAPAAPLKPGELPSFPAPSFRPVFTPVASPAPQAAAPTPAPPRLQDLLRKDFQPLYALLDAAREPSVLKVIYESKEEFQSLYEGAPGAQLAHFAPYLVRVPEKSPLIETLVNQAWSKSWGVFLTCDKPLKELRAHFRHFLNVKLPDGKQVYFRYYDPRVLRLFLPTCLPEEINQFFGPIKHFLIEAEDSATALHFTRGPEGAAQKDLHLAPT